MIYRDFSKKIDFKPAAIGFGLMRLPMKDESIVDVPEAVKMVRHAIDNGVNYLDTAYIYHGGESEKILGEILKDGYREKVKIATKMPMWLLKEESDLDKIFFDQLDKIGVNKIDFYLLHALNKDSLDLITRLNIINWCEKKRSEGYIDYIGFSFHDTLPVWKSIIDFYDWDFCQLQFNIIDVKIQLDRTALEYAKKKDIGIIIMEPLRGGQLTSSIPEVIKKLWDKMAKLYGIDGSYNPIQFLLDWLWNFDEIGFMLSGMSSLQQVNDNLEFAKSAKVNSLTKEQLDLFDEIQSVYLKKIAIHCTKCNYCDICPQKIDIPQIFHCLNEVVRYEDQDTPTNIFYRAIPEEKRANKCINCGACVEVCPQRLEIPGLLSKCSKIFDEKEDYRDYY